MSLSGRGIGEGGYRRDHGYLSGGSWAKADTTGLYQGGGLQKRPWISIRGCGYKRDHKSLLGRRGGYRRDDGSLLRCGWAIVDTMGLF